jgi:hypothetical protein
MLNNSHLILTSTDDLDNDNIKFEYTQEKGLENSYGYGMNVIKTPFNSLKKMDTM